MLINLLQYNSHQVSQITLGPQVGVVGFLPVVFQVGAAIQQASSEGYRILVEHTRSPLNAFP